MLAARQSRNQKESIATRKGIRPKTVRGPLHIQCDGSGDGGRFRELIAEVLSWPNVECIPLLANSPDFISVHLKQGLGAITADIPASLNSVLDSSSALRGSSTLSRTTHGASWLTSFH